MQGKINAETRAKRDGFGPGFSYFIAPSFMQYYDLGHWFGRPNPPGWQPEPF
jgi:hypothetical protein